MKGNLFFSCLLLGCFVFLTGCKATPYAIIDGTQSKTSDHDNYDVNIVSIDGKMEFGDNIVNVKSGFHSINVTTTKNIRSKSRQVKMFPVNAKECFRYVVTAQHTNSMTDDWEVKLLRETPIPSCTPSEKVEEVVEIPSYLAPNQEPTCINSSTLSELDNPAILYSSIKACILSGEIEAATYNYFLASAYGIYDTQRVVDPTAHQAINLIQKHSIWTLTALEQEKFEQKLTVFINTPASMQKACSLIETIGKPGYFPEYMIEHGVKKLTEENPDGLVNNFTADKNWNEVLTNQLKCG